MGIVPDDSLRNLLSKGPKYREPLTFSCDNAKTSILNGVESMVSNWSSRVGISKEAFKEWKACVAQAVDDRISSLKEKKRKSSSILSRPSSKSCLADLQSKYVMVPIDKAANNIAFVQKILCPSYPEGTWLNGLIIIHLY